MKIYALWAPIFVQMVKTAETEKDESINFFALNCTEEVPPKIFGRVEDSLFVSVLAEITCECGEKYTIAVSCKKPLKKGDYIVFWVPEMGKTEFKEFAKLSIIASEEPRVKKIFEILDAKVKFDNFTISGGCNCREMSDMETLTGGRRK